MPEAQVLKKADPRIRLLKDASTGDTIIGVQIPDVLERDMDALKRRIMRALDSLKDAVWDYPNTAHPLLRGFTSVRVVGANDQRGKEGDSSKDSTAPPPVPNTSLPVLR